MSVPASRAVLRHSRFALRRAAVRNASTTSEAAGAAKDKASQVTSKASEGLSKVTSSAGSVLVKAGSMASNTLGKVGGRTGQVIGFVQCKFMSDMLRTAPIALGWMSMDEIYDSSHV